jgi:glycosyltransferase involved in cell wall biosynthesis
MKVGISAFAGDGGKSGISQYMKHIFKRLPGLSEEDEYVLFMSKSDRNFFELDHPRVKIVTVADWVSKPVINILWHALILPLALARHQCDIVFMPAANRRLSWWYGIPSVGTVHDLSQLHIPGKYDAFRMVYATRLLPAMMRKLTHVISVSHSTRRDLTNHAHVDDASIEVVYNGADLDRYSPTLRTKGQKLARQKYGIEGPYILYTARLEHPGKNHVGLLKAFAALKQKTGIPHKLVLSGSPWSGADTIYAAAHEYGIEDSVYFTGFVADEDLPRLYAGADLFAFPSLFEGFGIPLLEAMAAGTPVCASRVASMPEVVRDAGLLFDPENTEAIADSLQMLIEDQALRKQLVQKGLRQAKLFSWDDAARQTHAVLNLVNAENSHAVANCR